MATTASSPGRAGPRCAPRPARRVRRLASPRPHPLPARPRPTSPAPHQPQADDRADFDLRTTLERRDARHELYCSANSELGRGSERQRLPDCVVNAIRRAFPDPQERYVGYKPQPR